MRSEMCSLHLTECRVHIVSVHTWSSGQPTVQRPGSSRGLPVRAGIRTHNLGLPRVSSPTLYPLGQRLLTANDCLLPITWRISCYNFKTLLKSWEIWKIMLLNVSIAHIQPRIYGFSWTVILIGSSQSTETYLGGEELWFESRVITVQQSKPNLHIRKLKWHGCINKHVCISVLQLWTLLGRFRVGFGVGNISSTIEH